MCIIIYGDMISLDVDKFAINDLGRAFNNAWRECGFDPDISTLRHQRVETHIQERRRPT
jgi:hypothetical protein